MKVEKKVLIITGGSRGIGASISIKAAQMGYSVCVNYEKSYKKANQVVEEINSNGGEAITVQADISSAKEVEHLFTTVETKLGTLRALVNNAGISGPRTKLIDLEASEMKRVFKVNLFGSFYCAKEAVQRMSLSNRGKGGAIVNISSQAAEFGGNGLSPYAASKAAINNFTIALSREVAIEGIRVNAIGPTYTKTRLVKNLSEDPNKLNFIIERTPLGRLAEVSEMAGGILFLASDASSMVTGHTLMIDGGWSSN